MESMTFDSFELSEALQKALQKMGFKSPTPVQAQSIPAMLKGGDVTSQAPTGTGKTAAFGIPVVEQTVIGGRGARTLILSPTRELALQTANVLRQLASFRPGLRIACVYGGENIQKQIAQLRRHPQIVVATPGRLIDHMQRKTIVLDEINTVVLDEADRMLDMGFLPDMDKILEQVPDNRRTALFSATLSKEILAIASRYQTNPVFLQIKQQTQTVDTVEQFYKEVEKGSKKEELLLLLEGDTKGTSLIFVNTKKAAEQIALYLERKGYRAASLHGDMRQTARDRVMAQYRKGSLEILVATDVAARGIDVDDIGMVINYDIPMESESYVHRIGRTGRAERKGIAYTFIYADERGRMRSILDATRAKIQPMEGTDPSLLKASPSAKKYKSSNRRYGNGYSGQRSKQAGQGQKPRRSSGKNSYKPKPSNNKTA